MFKIQFWCESLNYDVHVRVYVVCETTFLCVIMRLLFRAGVVNVHLQSAEQQPEPDPEGGIVEAGCLPTSLRYICLVVGVY